MNFPNCDTDKAKDKACLKENEDQKLSKHPPKEDSRVVRPFSIFGYYARKPQVGERRQSVYKRLNELIGEAIAIKDHEEITLTFLEGDGSIAHVFLPNPNYHNDNR